MNLTHAIENNIALYSAVLNAHAIRATLSPECWSSDAPTPPYYSNLVTRTAHDTAAQIVRIRALADAPPEKGWGLKDSFAMLESSMLESIGLRMLFEAHWFGCEQGATHHDEAETNTEFVSISTLMALARWEAAWQRTSPAPCMRVFPESILVDESVTIIALLDNGALVGGVILNESEEAIGLSNFFALDSARSAPLLRDCVRAAQRRYPAHHVVGYGPEIECAELAGVGARTLGPLRVWVSD